MSCDSSANSFPTATLMGQMATNLPVVWEEICAIQQAILAASSQCQPGGGQMSVVVGGNTPMTFVTGVESITVVDGGAGYYQDTPTINFIPPVGVVPSSVATGTVTTNGGNILAVNITAPGAGYQPVSATMSVSSVSGLNAVLQPLVDGSGGIVNINIVDGGVGYTVDDTVTATRAVLPDIAYVDAVFRITSVSVTGQIIEVAILLPGSGYQDSVPTVEIVSSLNPALPYPLGTGFMCNVFTDIAGAITDVVITNTGAGYATYLPYLVITDPGTGATTSVTLTGTAVSSIAVLTPGTQYTTSAVGNVFNPPTAALPNPPTTPAVVTINTSVNTFGTTPNLYWNVWAGTVTNKPIQTQLNAVLSYFASLGYTIVIQSNPATGSTIQWYISW